jgi:hypothetical protein
VKTLRWAAALLLILVGLTVNAATLEEFIASAKKTIGPRYAAGVEADLKAISKIKGTQASKLNDEVFRSTNGISGEGYLKFFLDRVKQIKMDPNPLAKYVASFSNSTMYIGKTYLEAPAMARLTTLIHESAHDRDFRGHAKCPIPFLDENGKDRVSEISGVKLEGKSACAERFADAYVTEFIFLKNTVSYCLNCSAKMKTDAKFYADKVLIRVLDEKLKDQLATDQ